MESASISLAATCAASTESKTDTANGQRLVARYGADIRYVWPWGQWLVWDGRRWEPDCSGAIERLAKETALSIYHDIPGIHDSKARDELAEWAKSSQSAQRIAAMIRMAQSELSVVQSLETLDANHWLLNLPNGTLDLRTGQVRGHRREDSITKLCPTEFDPTRHYSCPVWMEFIRRTFSGNDQLIGFVQRVLGYVLTGDVSQQILPILWGSGANGKSTLTETMLSVVGSDYASAAPDDLLLARRRDSHPTVTADLFGRRFVVASESDQHARLAEGLVKRLTGGDEIRARKCKKDYFGFRPTHKILFITNHRPQIVGTDDGIWRRIRLIPFANTIPASERDPNLLDKLRAEASGILKWCVDGCLQWQADGELGEPDVVRDATDTYRSDQDTLQQWLEDCCQVGDGLKARSGNLYDSFKQWSKANSLDPISSRLFGERMESRFVRRKSNGFWYHGIELKHVDELAA